MEDEIEHSVDGCSPDNYVALENTQRIIVIIAHYVSDVLLVESGMNRQATNISLSLQSVLL